MRCGGTHNTLSFLTLVRIEPSVFYQMNILQQELDEFRRTEDGMVIQGANHTSRILNHKYRNKIIMSSYADLKQLPFEYDSIVCCGASGLMIVPQIAEILNKNIVIVRKQDDNSYSKFMVEGVASKKYIIVDDLICSGDTIRHIMRSIKEESRNSVCCGVYSYMKELCAYRKRPELCVKDLGICYL